MKSYLTIISVIIFVLMGSGIMKAQDEGKPKIYTRVQRIEMTVDTLKNRLNLSDAQTEKVKSAYLAHNEEFLKIRDKLQVSSDKIISSTIAKMLDKLYKKVNGYLNKEQKVEFKKYVDLKTKIRKGGLPATAINSNMKTKN